MFLSPDETIQKLAVGSVAPEPIPPRELKSRSDSNRSPGSIGAVRSNMNPRWRTEGSVAPDPHFVLLVFCGTDERAATPLRRNVDSDGKSRGLMETTFRENAESRWQGSTFRGGSDGGAKEETASSETKGETCFD